jgi:two-component system nitrogen regulation sensor histidine kinase NtrY
MNSPRESEASSDSAQFPRPPRGLSAWFAPAVVALALFSALVTFLVLTGLTPLIPTHNVVVVALLTNATLILVLGAIVAWEIWGLIRARRRGRAAARLHVRIVLLFAFMAIVPAILVAVIASITLDRGLDRWFSARTRAIIGDAAAVAQTYVREHAFGIRAEVVAMGDDLARMRELFDKDRERFRQILTAQAHVRGLPAAMLIRPDLSVIERAQVQFPREFIVPPNLAVREASVERPLVYLADEADFVAATIPLLGFDNTYLYVARPIDPQVVQYLRQTQANIAEYASLEERRLGVQVAFALMYGVIAMILLLSAVWLGINFANRLVAPIRRLITAANMVASGNLSVQVPVRRAEGDLAVLGSSFNAMTQELRSQHEDLVRASEQIDQRRRFTEAVLAGVDSAVIGLDPEGRITILNRFAEQFTGYSADSLIGAPIVEILPELAPLVQQALAGSVRVQGTVVIARGGRERTMNVRVTTEQAPEAEHGYVLTLDDITQLVSAQRTSAWADIARRIAHEIKNPLTPIQLSAERLRRKYGKVLTEDREVFEQCTETIIRQVGDIGRMVDEFSSFARTPKPVAERQDLAETVRQVVFLMRVGHPDITFDVDLPDTPTLVTFDRRLISQALTNVLKNATEAIAAVPAAEREQGRVQVRLGQTGREAVIDVIDNGIGLPEQNRERLMEPYVTTREKGTGLGLAIVSKILEQHGGVVELHDAPATNGRRGAWVRMRFAVDGVAAAAAAEQDAAAAG